MSSNDDTNGKNPENETKVVEFGKVTKNSTGAKDKKALAVKPKKKISLSWVLGMIILLLIAVSFVLAPAIEALMGGKNSNSIVFGKYGKEDISYSYGNYFYDQVQNYATQYKTTDGNTTQTLYQIWKSAYDSTVMFTAISQIAKQAGIIAADDVVNRAIIDSGAYNKDGKFDVESYQNATAEKKASVEASVRRSVPYQIVVDDIGTALSSSAEADYVAAMVSNGRTFKYVDFNASLYPDQKASEYALQNKQLFYSMDLSIISLETEEEAKTIASAIANGEKTFEETAVASSKDSYAAKQGKVGKVFYYSLASNFKNADDATKLLTAQAGDVIGPIEGPNAWSLYRLDSTPSEADYADTATLSAVKAYLAYNDNAIVDEYLVARANQFALDAKNGFEEAAEKADLSVITVAATPLNLSSSSYMNSFSNTDPNGILATAAADEAQAKLLYTQPVGTILDPIKSNTSYLVAQIDEEKSDDSTSSYIKMFYNYLSGTQNQQDFSQSLYASDKFSDNFLGTFFSVILGKST